jgi:hypothetical protein
LQPIGQRLQPVLMINSLNGTIRRHLLLLH